MEQTSVVDFKGGVQQAYVETDTLTLAADPIVQYMTKADLKKSQLTLTWWQLSVPPAPGSYRVEVLLNDRPVWRGTLRITP